MALRMRLTRLGSKKKPFYRIIVTERTAPRDGKFVEIVGTYDPLSNPPTVNLKEERVKHWLSHGVSPSETVESLLRNHGILEKEAK